MVTLADWQEVRLVDLYDVKSSRRVLQSDWRPSGVPFYRGREITELSERGTVQNDLFIDQELFDTLRSRYGAPGPGDILVSAIGTIGNVFLVSGDHDFYFKDASVLWLRSRGAVDSSFVRQWMRSVGFRSQLPTGNGTTVDTLTIGTLAGLRVPLPPLKEQEAIAEALSDADAAIEALDALIAKKRDVKQAAMQQLLAGRTRLPGFSKAWSVQRLGRILSLEYGAPLKEGDRSGSGFPVMASAGVVGYHQTALVSDDAAIVVGRKGTAGAVYWSSGPCWPIDTAYYVKIRQPTDLRWLFYLLGDSKLPSLAEQTGVPGLNRDRVYEREVLMPEIIEEQTKIAEVLSDMDSEIEALVAERDKLRLVKQGMMQELLSGRVRLV